MSQTGTTAGLGIPTSRFLATNDGQAGIGAAPVDVTWETAIPTAFSRNFPALEGGGTTFVLRPNIEWLIEAYIEASGFSDAVNGQALALFVDELNNPLNSIVEGVLMLSIGSVGIDPDVNPTGRPIQILIRRATEFRVKVRLDAFTGTLDLLGGPSYVNIQPLI